MENNKRIELVLAKERLEFAKIKLAETKKINENLQKEIDKLNVVLNNRKKGK